MVEKGSFDERAFFAALDSVRQVRGLNWRQVAEAAAVSPSTLTRLAQGKRPDVDSLAALVDWAGLSADDFVIRVHGQQTTEPLAMISTYLRADRSLSPEAATAINTVVKAAYEALRKV
jgi:transcriptional regulator with XRE-family HTH domain